MNVHTMVYRKFVFVKDSSLRRDWRGNAPGNAGVSWTATLEAPIHSTDERGSCYSSSRSL
jgi:hypothetical protein